MGLFFEVLPFNHLDSPKENVCLYKACAYAAKNQEAAHLSTKMDAASLSSGNIFKSG